MIRNQNILLRSHPFTNEIDNVRQLHVNIFYLENSTKCTHNARVCLPWQLKSGINIQQHKYLTLFSFFFFSFVISHASLLNWQRKHIFVIELAEKNEVTTNYATHTTKKNPKSDFLDHSFSMELRSSRTEWYIFGIFKLIFVGKLVCWHQQIEQLRKKPCIVSNKLYSTGITYRF